MPRATARSTVRNAAKARGERFYFTGETCPNGHVSDRYVSTHNCVECSRAVTAALKAATVVRKALAPKSARQAAKNAGLTRYISGKLCPRGHASERLVSTGGCLECAKILTAEREAGNAELIERKIIYRQNNRERYRAHVRNRRAKLITVGMHTAQDIEELWDVQIGHCAYCNVILCGGYHVDHKQPLSKGGTNDAGNLHLTCQTCNLTKNNKTDAEFRSLIALRVA